MEQFIHKPKGGERWVPGRECLKDIPPLLKLSPKTREKVDFFHKKMQF